LTGILSLNNSFALIYAIFCTEKAGARRYPLKNLTVTKHGILAAGF